MVEGEGVVVGGVGGTGGGIRQWAWGVNRHPLIDGQSWGVGSRG